MVPTIYENNKNEQKVKKTINVDKNFTSIMIVILCFIFGGVSIILRIEAQNYIINNEININVIVL